MKFHFRRVPWEGLPIANRHWITLEIIPPSQAVKCTEELLQWARIEQNVVFKDEEKPVSDCIWFDCRQCAGNNESERLNGTFIIYWLQFLCIECVCGLISPEWE